MSSRLVAAGLLGVLAVTFAGCSSKAEREADATSSYESEMKLSGIRYLGRLKNGQTRTGYYYNPPMYRSYAFDATGGDAIAIDVKSGWGDALAWITDANYNVLAFNDDDPESHWLDARVKYTVPADQGVGSYRVVFRDYDKLDALFTVTLNITSTAPVEPTSCTYDGQVYKPGDDFAATDGCNTCSCGEEGEIACTKMACVCNPANEPKRTYVGNPQQCTVIRYTCQPGQVPFSNSCGCGCETL